MNNIQDTINPSEMQYAGFWVRFAASLLDMLWQLILLAVVIFFMWETFAASATAESSQISLVGILLQYVLPAVIYIGFWVKFGATPGKMALGLKIRRAADGGQPSIGQFIGRYVAYFLSAIPLGLGFLWVAFDKRKQGWHDKLSGTVVVKTN